MGTRSEKTKDVLKAYYLSKEIARLSGLSGYMVTYLRQVGLLIPVGQATPTSTAKRPRYGKPRLYQFSDVLLARSIRKLLDAGVSVKEIEESIRVLREKLGGVPRDLTTTRVTIIGKRIFVASPNEQPVELTADGQLAFSYMLDVKGLQDAASKVIAGRDAKDYRRVARHGPFASRATR